MLTASSPATNCAKTVLRISILVADVPSTRLDKSIKYSARRTNGGWAHASPVEAGALLCRLPMPATFIQQMRDGSSGVWPTKLRERMRTELPEATDEMDADALFAKWSANTNYAYKLAEATIAASVRSM